MNTVSEFDLKLCFHSRRGFIFLLTEINGRQTVPSYKDSVI